MFAVPDAFAAAFLVCFFLGLVYVLVSAFIGAGHDIADGIGDAGAVDVGHGDIGHTDAGHADVGDMGPGDGGEMGHAGDGGHFGDIAHHGDAVHGGGHTGDIFGHVDHVAHAHAGAQDAAHAQAESKQPSASPLNLMTVMAFLTWFGAAAYIAYVPLALSLFISIPLGIIIGLLGGWIVYTFLVKILLRGTTVVSGPEYRVVGKLAQVTIPIGPGQVGEVVYTIAGTRHSDGARSVDGQPIPRGAEVAIVGFERGVALVEPLQQLLNEAESDKGTSST